MISVNARHSAFSLVELIIFIIILGLAGIIVMPAMRVMSSSANQQNNLQAMQLARGRMELILQEKNHNGFSGLTDPCSSGPALLCTAPTGFTINTTISANWNSDTDFKEITVTVTGDGDATLKTVVSNT